MAATPPHPQGTLVLIGGSEDRGPAVNRPAMAAYHPAYLEQEILRFLLTQTGLWHPRIVVVVSASNMPVEMGEMYQLAFAHLQQPHLDILHFPDRAAADSAAAETRLRAAQIVLFSGGDQLRLVELLFDTRFHHVLLQRYWHEPLVVAGTSAGSMAFPRTMLAEGSCGEAMLRGDVELAAGLGLLGGCIVDTHFVKRGRFSRLAQAVLTDRTLVGVGLGEDTALVIRRGSEAECLGSGMVVLIDGHDLGATNVATAAEGAPLYAENLRVHCLVRGNRYDLQTRTFSAQRSESAVSTVPAG